MSEQFSMPHDWPEESREAAQLVADAFGAPDEATPTQLVWHEGARDMQQARDDYAEEFLNARRKRPTPYMDELQFQAESHEDTVDPDERVLSDEDLERAVAQGEQQDSSPGSTEPDDSGTT